MKFNKANKASSTQIAPKQSAKLEPLKFPRTNLNSDGMGTHVIRVKEVLQIWQKLCSLDTLPQVDKWLAEQFKSQTKYGSKDRKWYSEVLFGMVRFAPWVADTMKFKGFSEQGFLASIKVLDPSAFVYWTLLRLSWQRTTPDFDGAVSVLSKNLRRVASEDQALLEKDSARPEFFGFSEKLMTEMKARQTLSGLTETQTQKFIEAQATRPPLWLRLNFLDKKDLVVAELKSLDFEVQNLVTSEVGAAALCVVGTKGIFATEAYMKGWIEIQDLASQFIGQGVAFKPGEFVWDACAGGGGKTMQLGSLSLNKGVIYASDIREYKLEEVKKRARRAGFFNIRCAPWNGVGTLDFSKEVKLRGGFDWVLVDAPCSSSGTWRRNPDAKYRCSPADLASLNALQLQLLTEASKSVREGGSIVYSTCSWYVSENEGVVELFLKEHSQFKCIQKSLVGLPEYDADAMFVAVMKRVRGT